MAKYKNVYNLVYLIISILCFSFGIAIMYFQFVYCVKSMCYKIVAFCNLIFLVNILN